MRSAPSPEVDNVVQQSFYVIFGVAGAVSNAVIIITILLNRNLYQKAYGLIAALAIADIFTDVGLFSLGINRLRILVSQRMSESLTNWECLIKLPILLSIVGPQTAVLVTFVSASDRLLSTTTSAPWYRGHAKRYTFLVLTCFVVGFGSYAWTFYALSAAGTKDQRLAALCSFHETFPTEMLLFYFVTQTVAGWGSTLAILIALVLAKCHPLTAGYTSAQFRQQNEITQSVAISVSASFLLWFLPATVLAFGYATGADKANLAAFSPYLWMLIELRSTLNMFIYFWQDKALRDGAQVQLCREQTDQSVGIRRRWSSRIGRDSKVIRYQVSRMSSGESGRRNSETTQLAANTGIDAVDECF